MRETLVRNCHVSTEFNCSSTNANTDLREHAIFTLHSLIQHNTENQAVVDAMQPSGQWDEYAVLQDTSSPMHD